MLNGKFYTGLPPKMVERSNSLSKNRMESHFFWPDDTDTETAVETRVRRRASINLGATNKPVIQKRNAEAEDGVDTKKMLHKEFAKSSIQFFDNICEEEEYSPYGRRKGKQPITKKPTATKLELPESETDTVASKKKNVYDSKVEFFDFPEDERNNLRKNKVDMNDKKELEKNTKNSPKLLNKRNVNNFMANKYINNEQTEANMDSGFEDRYRKRNHGSGATDEYRDNLYNDSEDEHLSQLRKGRTKSIEASKYGRNNKYRRDQTPKRILKPALKNGVDYSMYPECRDDGLYNEASDYMDEAFKHMQINGRRPILKKHVSYSEEEEEIPVRIYNRNNADYNDFSYRKDSKLSKYRNNAHSARLNAENKRSQQQQRERHQSPDFEQSDCEQDQYMETKSNYNNNNPMNKFNNNNNNNGNPNNVKNNNNDSNNTNRNNKSINISHLRSSLCFHDGEIVGSDIEPATTTTKPTETSTQQRRNARNAATSRVSVGLPD